jgi:hypothetical protein
MKGSSSRAARALFFGVLAAIVQCTLGSSSELTVEFSETDASFKVSVGGSTWVESALLRVFTDGEWQKIAKTGATQSTGSDELGSFSCTNVSWVSDSKVVLHTSLKMYADVAIFVQQLPFGAKQTNASNPVLPGGYILDPGDWPPVVAFPSFTGGQLQTLGYITWQSRMVNIEWGTNITNGPHGTDEPLVNGTGLQGLSTNGPVVLFDEEFNSLVVSPMDNFKSAVHTANGMAWETGVSSELEELPPGFEHRTMLVAGSGITATIDAWGQMLRKVYATQRITDDPNVEFLTYW